MLLHPKWRGEDEEDEKKGKEWSALDVCEGKSLLYALYIDMNENLYKRNLWIILEIWFWTCKVF